MNNKSRISIWLSKGCSFLLAIALFVSGSSECKANPGERPAPGQPDNVALPAAFPKLDYTPFGYIDNPYHSMVYNRSGVIRSYPPLGFGWWRTEFEGNYGGGVQDHVNYLSLLQMSVMLDGKVFLSSDDFVSNGVALSSAYHSKHLMSYDWDSKDTHVSLRFFLSGENSLVCMAEFRNNAGKPANAVVHATHLYRIGDTKWWGSDGISARYLPSPDVSVDKIWAYGDVFVLGADMQSSAHTATADQRQWEQWIRTSDTTSVPSASIKGAGPMRVVQRYGIAIPAHGGRSILFVLSRGKNEVSAREELANGKRTALASLREQLANDSTFWTSCPVLEGDWPETWKRGWVYDFETLRMNVRNPLGIFKHRWDAMQVHSPRAVLGETCLDMMTMSYADSRLAREVIYGTFADAPMPNVPCTREDGSMNMISADGSECGTAPMWGYPFHMIKSIYLATHDEGWIKQLYPFLKAYIDWWLEHRTDKDGWLHCNNSWESGQDGSRRFLVAEHNEGAVADFVRTVDVEASMAEAMRNMELFATIAGKSGDAGAWRVAAKRREENTQKMFVDGWFRDVDGRTNTPIILKDYYDIMMLSPLTCDVATNEQVKAVKPMFRAFLDKQQRWLEWPPALFTYVEAAWRAGTRIEAAEAVARTADRVYQRTDARTISFQEGPFDYRIPGVANEFWPSRDVPAGGENYGWGATLPMNVIRSIIGFRESVGSTDSIEFALVPALPASLALPGKSYTVRNLHFRNATFDVTYKCGADSSIALSMHIRLPEKMVVSVTREDSELMARSDGRSATATLNFNAANGTIYTIRWL